MTKLILCRKVFFYFNEIFMEFLITIFDKHSSLKKMIFCLLHVTEFYLIAQFLTI